MSKARVWKTGRGVGTAVLLSCVLGLPGGSSAAPLRTSWLPRQSLSTGLVAYWPLDTVVGTTTPDASTSSPPNTATLVGGPTLAPGKIGNGITLTAASSQYLSVADATSLEFGTGSFSVAFWAMPTNITTKVRVINKWDSAPSKGWLLDFNSDAGGGNVAGAIRFRISDGTSNTALVTAGGVLTSTTTFVHIAAVADRGGSVLRLYVNGVEDLSSPMPIVGNPDVSEPGVSLGIGTIVNGLGSYYGGMLDDIRVYNRVLSPTEVLDLATFTGPPTAATNLTATAPSSFEVDLTWVGGSQVATYNVERSPQGQNAWSAIATGLFATTLAYQDMTVSPGTGYDYHVVSVNPLGTATSTPVSITTPAAPPAGKGESNPKCALGTAASPFPVGLVAASVLLGAALLLATRRR